MKNIRHFIPALLLVCAIAMTTGCSTQSDPDPDTSENTNNNGNSSDAPAISEQAKTDGQSVKQNEAPQSDKQKGEQTVSGHTVESPSTVSLSSEAQSQLALLTGGNSSAGQTAGTKVAEDALFGWFIDEINGEDVIGTEAGDTYVYFFYDDGYYYEYNLVTDEWDWGYFYVNTDVSTVVFDIDSDAESIWEVNTLTDETLDITQGSDNVVLNAYFLGDFDEDEYDEADLETSITGTELILAYEVNEGVDIVEDDTLLDIIEFGTGSKNFNVLKFYDDGTLDIFSRKYTFDNYAISGFEDAEPAEGVWEVDEFGWLYIDFPLNTELYYEFSIIYADSEELELEGFGYDVPDQYDAYWYLLNEPLFEIDLFGEDPTL